MVVSDTSPLINLALVGQLHLLEPLYTTVLIPQAVVHDEFLAIASTQPGIPAITALPWIEIREVTDPVLAESLMLELDPGEAEAIALAIETAADLLLLDERRGRRVAARFGLKFIGLLGTLIEAKHRGLVGAVKPVLDALITTAGFWISHDLYDRVLREAGE